MTRNETDLATRSARAPKLRGFLRRMADLDSAAENTVAAEEIMPITEKDVNAFEVANRCLEEGFTNVAVGSGPWIEHPSGWDSRIVIEYVFTHPENRAVVVAQHKLRSPALQTIQQGTHRSDGDIEALIRHLDKWGIKLGPTEDLAESIARQKKRNLAEDQEP